MLNHVVLIGRMTKEAQVKEFESGTKNATFTLAVNRLSKDKEQADYINCVVWGNVANVVEKYTHKGSLVALKGAIQTRSYENEGRTIYVTEVVGQQLSLLDSKKKEESSTGVGLEISSDDLPF